MSTDRAAKPPLVTAGPGVSGRCKPPASHTLPSPGPLLSHPPDCASPQRSGGIAPFGLFPTGESPALTFTVRTPARHLET